MRPGAGDLKQSITLQAPVRSRAANGDFYVEFPESGHERRWANITYQGVQEGDSPGESAQIVGETKAMAEIRFHGSVSAAWQVIYRGESWNIEGVEHEGVSDMTTLILSQGRAEA